jgi:hypothetical protein
VDSSSKSLQNRDQTSRDILSRFSLKHLNDNDFFWLPTAGKLRGGYSRPPLHESPLEPEKPVDQIAGCRVLVGPVRASADVRRIARIHVAHTENVAMRTYDFTPLWRSSIGFDRVFDLLNNNSSLLEGQGDWPPYDIARTGEDTYRITLALAGFSPEEISITAQ